MKKLETGVIIRLEELPSGAYVATALIDGETIGSQLSYAPEGAYSMLMPIIRDRLLVEAEAKMASLEELVKNIDPKAKLPRRFDLWSVKLQMMWLQNHQRKGKQ